MAWESRGLSLFRTISASLQDTVEPLLKKWQMKVNQRFLALKQAIEQKADCPGVPFIAIQKQSTALQAQLHQLEQALSLQKKENKELSATLVIEQLELSRLCGYSSTLAQQLAEQKTETKTLHTLLSNLQKNLEYAQHSLTNLEQDTTTLKQQLSFETDEKNKFKALIEEFSRALELSEQKREKLERDFRGQEINAKTSKE